MVVGGARLLHGGHRRLDGRVDLGGQLGAQFEDGGTGEVVAAGGAPSAGKQVADLASDRPKAVRARQFRADLVMDGELAYVAAFAVLHIGDRGAGGEQFCAGDLLAKSAHGGDSVLTLARLAVISWSVVA